MIESSLPRTARELVLTNCLLQLPDEELRGTVVCREGRIAAIEGGTTPTGVDLDGAIVMPGLVELHTDNLEIRMAPRPGVRWPLGAAALYHDRDMIAAGITTVCDAIAIGDIATGTARMTHFAPMIDTIAAGMARGAYAADHRIHLRCELVFSELVEIVRAYAEQPLLILVSVMDHTPGQRQFMDIEKFTNYYVGKHGVPRDDIEIFIARRREDQLAWSERNRADVVAIARERRIALATHDDATQQHVDQALAEGATIAEFPTTLEAARAAHRAGMLVVVGGPNLVLGGSHSGNVSAVDLVREGVADIISSDYVPQSLLHAAFVSASAAGIPLHRAMRAVTSAPARAIGLDGDRGSIEIGKRADLLVVVPTDAGPSLEGVYRDGARVA